MKNQDEIKDKIIEFGIDTGMSLVMSFAKDKLFPKKKEVVSVTTSNISQKKSKPKIFRKLILGYILKETVIDRIKAKVNVKANRKDYSWLIDYPLGNNIIDLNDLIRNVGQDDKVLDLGSGTGYFGIEIARNINQNNKVVCLDNDMESLKESQKLSEILNITNIEFHRANIEKMPFEADKFDKVFLNMTFGQLTDKITSLNEIHRILKTNGKLFITEILLDDNYCVSNTIITLANNSGFKVTAHKGNFAAYTLTLEKR